MVTFRRSDPRTEDAIVFRNILIATDGSPHAQASLDAALWLAPRVKGTVHIEHVIDLVALEGPFLHDLSGSLGFEPFLNFSTRVRETLAERGRTILDEAARKAAAAGVEADTHLEYGIVPNEICERGKIADLIVVGAKGMNARFERGLLGSVTEAVTRRASKPVLVIPGPFGCIASPLLPYDGSSPAGKALEKAAELSSALGLPLTIVAFSDDEEEREKRAEEVRSYLKPYSLAVHIEAGSGAPATAILETVRTGGHDLIVMGAFGHSRIMEMVLGSTTETVLRQSSVPVLLTH